MSTSVATAVDTVKWLVLASARCVLAMLVIARMQCRSYDQTHHLYKHPVHYIVAAWLPLTPFADILVTVRCLIIICFMLFWSLFSTCVMPNALGSDLVIVRSFLGCQLNHAWPTIMVSSTLNIDALVQ